MDRYPTSSIPLLASFLAAYDARLDRMSSVPIKSNGHSQKACFCFTGPAVTATTSTSLTDKPIHHCSVIHIISRLPEAEKCEARYSKYPKMQLSHGDEIISPLYHEYLADALKRCNLPTH